jgi:hypothetical protein
LDCGTEIEIVDYAYAPGALLVAFHCPNPNCSAKFNFVQGELVRVNSESHAIYKLDDLADIEEHKFVCPCCEFEFKLSSFKADLERTRCFCCKAVLYLENREIIKYEAKRSCPVCAKTHWHKGLEGIENYCVQCIEKIKVFKKLEKIKQPKPKPKPKPGQRKVKFI